MVGDGEGGGSSHGVRFAEPARGERVDGDDLEIGAGEGLHDGPGGVGAAVIDGKDAQVGVVLGEEGLEAGGYVCFFVAGGDDDR